MATNPTSSTAVDFKALGNKLVRGGIGQAWILNAGEINPALATLEKVVVRFDSAYTPEKIAELLHNASIVAHIRNAHAKQMSLAVPANGRQPFPVGTPMSQLPQLFKGGAMTATGAVKRSPTELSMQIAGLCTRGTSYEAHSKPLHSARVDESQHVQTDGSVFFTVTLPSGQVFRVVIAEQVSK